MNTNERPDFYNEVENDEIPAVISPTADEDMTFDMDDSVHLIGGEAFGGDAIDDFTPEAFVMDVDSDETFDFVIADENSQGIIDVEAIDVLDDIDADALVMDVDSDGTFDFAIVDENNDGFIDADEVLDTLDGIPDELRGNIIGLDKIDPEGDYESAALVDEEQYVDDWHSDDGVDGVDDPSTFDTTEGLYLDNGDVDDVGMMPDDFGDF